MFILMLYPRVNYVQEACKQVQFSRLENNDWVIISYNRDENGKGQNQLLWYVLV